MNNTKWDELRMAMYDLGDLHPRWRTKDVHTGYICPWDGEWYYHFRDGGYDTIEWVDIETVNETQREAVLHELCKIHVPGFATSYGFRVVGWVSPDTSVAYIEKVA